MDLASTNRKKTWPWVAIALILIVSVYQLHRQGRVAWCSCGKINLWEGDIWSSHCSQHLFDPYSFSHALHGILLYWIISWLFKRLALGWTLCLAVSLETLWEIFENSQFIINRYREATIALGYEGDSIINSMGDVFCCGVGFFLARYLRFRLALVLFVVTELIMLFWVRDNLTLNVLMLIYPVNAIKDWQMIH